MWVLGITGGIGSGKSAVTDCFQDLGISVVDADLAARRVVEPGQPALQTIAEHFGPEVIQQDGKLNRKALRSIVFANPTERQWLEQLTHPLIGKEIKQQLAASRSAYCILVSPLLLEGNQHRLVDRILVIDVPEAVQIKRTMTRDLNSESEVKAIIAAQMTREERLAKADDVLENTQGLAELRAEVSQLHDKYLEMARQQETTNRL